MRQRCVRRAFLRRATAGALMGLTAAARSATLAEAKSDEPSIPIIDTHQHLWDLRKFRLPWVKGAPVLNRNFLMDDYLRATEGLHVVKSVYMEVDVEPAQQVEEAEYVSEICRRKDTPMVAAVISGRPASGGFKDYLDRFRNAPEIKGIRQVLHSAETPPGYCVDARFIKGIQLLGERGLSFDVCLRPTELRDAARLIDACPGTSFILDHCGNADVRSPDLSSWRADIAEVAKRDRVVCKVSGIVASTKGAPWSPEDLAPIVDHVLEVFGPDRVVFGGDWPVCTLGATYRQWVEALRTIVRHRSQADQRKLFHENALRVYRLA